MNPEKATEKNVFSVKPVSPLFASEFVGGKICIECPKELDGSNRLGHFSTVLCILNRCRQHAESGLSSLLGMFCYLNNQVILFTVLSFTHPFIFQLDYNTGFLSGS